MSRSPKRYRGVVLTQQGIDRLEAAISTAQDEEKYGKRFTQAELSERANLSIKTIKKIRDRTAPVDEVSVRTLFEAFELSLEAADYGLPELPSPSAESEPVPQGTCLTTKIDWGEKPDTAIFFGRTEDLATLNQWVMTEQCRLITLLGMGGIGKTSLAAKLADQIYEQFDYVIWRSLREAPPLDEILVRLIQFLSDQQETEINLPTRLGERTIRLLHYLREHRCLLVLDNLESILQAESAGQFRDGYEGYGELIHRIGEAEHQSCLLLTSRECPRESALMAGEHLPVRLWPVNGIDSEAGQEILKAKGLNLEDGDNQGQELIRLYSGNPQALHLVATAIRREYLGDVNDFLEEEGAALEDVRSLLDQHLTRLAPLERSILFWLAINREPVGLDELMEDLLPPVTKREVRSALRGLTDRYLIETVGKQFTLQNVIMEFATDRFVEQVSRELNKQLFALFNTHALIKAAAKDYVRETQIRLILKPVKDRIDVLGEYIDNTLKNIRKRSHLHHGYSAGNLLNLLCQSHAQVVNYDFSKLTIRQAYLKGSQLHDLNLTNAVFFKLSLTYAFSRINAVVFNPNGEILAAADCSGQVQLWSVTNQNQVARLETQTTSVNSLAFSPNGQLLATGSEDATVQLWSVQECQRLQILTGHTEAVYTVAFSPDGQLLATGSKDTTIRLWNIQECQCFQELTGHTKSIYSVAFSPDNQLLATSGSNGEVRLWDIQKHQCLYTLIGHTSVVESAAFSPDGQLLATGSYDTTIRLWDIQKGQCIFTLTEHTDFIRSIAFSPDGQWLATGGEAVIRLWDIKQRQCLHVLTDHANDASSITFSPDSQKLAIGGTNATIQLWNIQERQCIYKFVGHINSIWSVAFSPDSHFLAASSGVIATSSGNPTIWLWDLQQHQWLPNFTDHTYPTYSVAFSSDSQLLAMASYINAENDDISTTRLWNIQQRRWLPTFTDSVNQAYSVAFSPNSQFLAVGNFEHSIEFWNIPKDQCIYTFKGHTGSVCSVAFSPDGQLLASGSFDNTTRLWDIQEGRCIHVLQGHTNFVRSVAISPTGQLLATGGYDNKIRLWDIQKGQCLHTFNDHNNAVWSVTFSPDGKLLASGADDFTVRIWDIQKKKCLRIFTGHQDYLRSVTFSPNGQTLASGGWDGTLRLWDVNTGDCLSVLRVPRPYEGTEIMGTQGLTAAQRASMIALGAIDHSSKS